MEENVLHDEEPAPRPGRPTLDRMGVAELEAYIAELRAEIAGAEAEIGRKQKLRNAADSFFKT